MIPTYLIAADQLTLLDLAGPADALRYANSASNTPLFDVHYCAPSPRVCTSSGLVLADLAPLPDTLEPGALVMVLGLSSQALPMLSAQHPVAAWLRRSVNVEQHRLATVCAGALLAAHAGLLAGRRCTTHHDVIEHLQAIEPRAIVLENRLFVEDEGVFTCAGVTAGIDLTLHLIERYGSPSIALAVARMLVVYLRRTGSDPQLSPLLAWRNHVHPAVHRAQNAVLAEPAALWESTKLAAIAHVTPRHLVRLFTREAGITPIDYVRHTRRALAEQLAQNSQLSREQIADRAGFASVQQLRRAENAHKKNPDQLLDRGLK